MGRAALDRLPFFRFNMAALCMEAQMEKMEGAVFLNKKAKFVFCGLAAMTAGLPFLLRGVNPFTRFMGFGVVALGIGTVLHEVFGERERDEPDTCPCLCRDDCCGACGACGYCCDLCSGCDDLQDGTEDSDEDADVSQAEDFIEDGMCDPVPEEVVLDEPKDFDPDLIEGTAYRPEWEEGYDVP